MTDTQQRGCSGCGRERSLVSGLCSNCRGFDHTANNTFGLLGSEVLAVEGGWRDARICDAEFAGWLCPHVHRTPEEAETCPEKGSILGRPRTS
jgi:hypothetical protein